jgi:hypothetical protein
MIWLPLAAALIVAAIYGLVRRRRAIRSRLRALWGKKSPVKRLEDDLVEDVAAYWRKRAETVAPGGQVDDITWGDLDMNDLFRRLDTCVSAVGSEVLYALLRETGAPPEALGRREDVIRAFRTDEEMRLDVQTALLRVGRSHFHGATAYLYRPEYSRPGVLYDILSLVPLLLLIGGAFFPPLLLGLVPSFCVNLVAHYRSDAIWSREIRAVTHIATVLSAAGRLSRRPAPGALGPEFGRIRSLTRRLRSIGRWAPLCGAADEGRDQLSALLMEYIKVAFLLNMVGLRRVFGRIAAHAEELREMYALVGELDALIAVAAVRETENVCAPEFSDEQSVEFAGLVHPLVASPVANDGIWDRNTLVTGSNASGKSTFIKALAINAILAQTICTCFAGRFRLCRARVMSSMAIRDDVQSGESYFVAEVRSLKRILDAAQGDGAVLAFVDEILRGTNTVERIAASSAVLRRLEGGSALLMAATHDIELTRILPGYANVHFREAVDERGVTFDYRLRPGPSQTRNAIALLEQMGFGDDIVRSAREMAARFEGEQRWPTL